MERLKRIGAGRTSGNGDHNEPRTDHGDRVPPPRGREWPQTERGRAGRGAVLVTDVSEVMREDEFRPFVVTGDPERMEGDPRARAPAALPIRFGLSVTTGPVKRAGTIRSGGPVTSTGAAPGTPRRDPIRFDRVVTTEPLKRAKTIRLSGPATTAGAAPTPPRRDLIRFDRSVATGPLKSAPAIRSSGPVTSTGAAPGTPRRGLIRFDRSVAAKV